METSRHEIHFADSRHMSAVGDDTIDLVVTSPPYPMVEMWDEQFAAADPSVGAALSEQAGVRAFELMHAVLDEVWSECHRILRPGGLACINVGDATRKIGGEFRLFSNHSRILQRMSSLGFSILPDILWRKPTNAPNKFLGSGMLPAGAYVTYEHEYILILRKGGPRRFPPADKERRRRSAFFWEERNVWFSDVWSDLTGTAQLMADRPARSRSARFPFELPYRLIQMHSLIGDTVLDPFLGTGTTVAAAIASGRSSLGFEIDPVLAPAIRDTIDGSVLAGRRRTERRLTAHTEFLRHFQETGRQCRHRNRPHGLPVVTAQETDLLLVKPHALTSSSPEEEDPRIFAEYRAMHR